MLPDLWVDTRFGVTPTEAHSTRVVPAHAHSFYAGVVRALVILPTGGYRAADFVRAAQALDVELTIASEEQLPLHEADRSIVIDCLRPRWSAERIADLASRTPIDAIVAADDSGVEIASMGSEMLGLAHHPPVAVSFTRNKAAMRERLRAAEVPQPRFRIVSPGQVTPAGNDLGYPVVVKARTLTASRGVLRADDAHQLAKAVARIQAIRAEAGEDPASDLVIERYIDGAEYTVEGLVWNGEFEVLAVMEKPDPLVGPAFQETMFVTPARLHDDVMDDLIVTVRRTVSALELSDGPIHAEARIGDAGPVLLEVAARTIGGLCGRALRFGLMGTSIEVLVLRHALGLRRRLPAPRGASGVLMIPIPAAGRLVGVEGIELAGSLANIEEIELTIGTGEWVAPPPEGDRYLGFVFARAPTTDLVEGALREANRVIHVRVELADGPLVNM